MYCSAFLIYDSNSYSDSIASENQSLDNTLVIEFWQSVFQEYNTRTLGRLGLNMAAAFQ